MELRKTLKGILIMLSSSLLTCLGQFCWKLAAERGILLVLAGFGLYGCGALLMIIALKYGELSVLHPMAAGVAVIILGLILISTSGKGEKT